MRSPRDSGESWSDMSFSRDSGENTTKIIMQKTHSCLKLVLPCHTNFGDEEMPLASPLPSQKIVQVQQVRNFYVLRSDTAVNLISIQVHKQRDYNVTKSRIFVYKQKLENTSEYIVTLPI